MCYSKDTVWLNLFLYSLRLGWGPKVESGDVGFAEVVCKINCGLDLVEECEVCQFWAISAAANLSFLPDEIKKQNKKTLHVFLGETIIHTGTYSEQR